MKLSFLVTSHNEGQQLFKLLYLLNEHLKTNPDDEIVILDDFSDAKDTIEVLTYFSKIKNNYVHNHKLEKDYSTHKNYGNGKCTGDFIFAIDADEIPTDVLLFNLKEILTVNESVDLYAVPRINIVHGLTEQYLRSLGWRMTPVAGFEHVPVINFPDYQSRIYRNAPHVKWERKLHEHIQGHKVSTKLPLEPSLSLIHEKTLDRQIQQNEFYNKNFSIQDNIRLI